LSKDEGWIVGLDVSVNHYAIQYHFEIDFESIQSVVLPQKYQISTTGKLMGFQGEYQYSTCLELSARKHRAYQRPLNINFVKFIIFKSVT
jgi:hypothetical protein